MTDNGGTTPPAGWYQDPRDARMLRWWDGSRWSEYTSPVPRRGPDPRHAVGEERKIVQWARLAIIGYAFLTVIGGALAFRTMTGFGAVFADILANPEAPPPANPFTGMTPGAAAALQLVNLVQLTAGIVLLIWMYRAALAADQLQIPAKRSPGWAIGGWFIPIVNFWFPYQSLRDLLPPEHPQRRRILLLWLLWIFGGIVGGVGLLLWTFDVQQGLYVGAIGYLATASAALAARTFIDAVTATHEQLAAESRRI